MKEGLRVVGLKERRRKKRRILYYEAWFGNAWIESGPDRADLIRKYGKTITIKNIS